MSGLKQYWQRVAEALEAAGHKLRRDEDGEIDTFVLSAGTHNGPGCELCGDSWCHHCLEPKDVKPCPGPGPREKALRESELAELARLKAKYEPSA